MGWNFYGERCLEYVAGRKKFAIYAYRILYIAAIFIGPYMTVQAVWNIADIFNGLMAIPNLIALILLSGVVFRETKSYFRRYPTMKSAALASSIDEAAEDAARRLEGEPPPNVPEELYIPPAEQAGERIAGRRTPHADPPQAGRAEEEGAAENVPPKEG